MKPILSGRSFPKLWDARYVLPLSIGILSLVLLKPALAQERTLRTLTVTGQGVEMVPTTLAQVSLGVEVQADTAVEAQRDAAQRSAAVVELLRSRDVSQLETTGISLSPRYNYAENEQRLIGYTASNIVSFQVSTEDAGALLDEAVQTGATRINGVTFTANDQAIAQARQIALREATEEAQEQADAVFTALGLSQQEIVSIQINGANAVPPPIPYRAAMAEAADASTPVVGGEQTVNASVTLEISY
ncbi:MAG: SIMPL domain-containing protein [Elainellaceae cyanobacterium]